MSNLNLTKGVISKLMRGEDVDKPLVQILFIKKIEGKAGASDRYRLTISDGTHFNNFGMLTTALNSMITNKELENFCVIQVGKTISNAIEGKRIIIIVELTVVAPGKQVGSKIGNPQQYNEGEGGAIKTIYSIPVERTAAVVQEINQRPPPTPPLPLPRPIRIAASAATPTTTTAGIQNHSQMMIIAPIRDLNLYSSKKLAIKARVTSKTPIKTWSNPRGEGKYFSCDLVDASGEIRITFFKQKVDSVFDLVQVGNVYQISNVSVKLANKQFSTLNNEFELNSLYDTQVTMCPNTDALEVPALAFDFVEISNIESIAKDKVIDVIGICKRREDCQTFTSRNTNREFTKRDIILVDKSNREVSVTLWNQQATDFYQGEITTNNPPVVAIKGVKVSDFAGKSLSCQTSSTILVNPDLTASHTLRSWYNTEGIKLDFISINVSKQGGEGGGGALRTQWKMFREESSMNENGDYYINKVTVMAIKRENAMYRACQEEKCNKKLVDLGNGQFWCEKCNCHGPDFKWRAMLKVNFADNSKDIWATSFQETAETILGSTSDVLGPIFINDQDQFESIIRKAVFKSYIAKFRCKMETFNNVSQLRHTLMEIHPINFGEYAKKLLNEIKEI